MITEDDRPGRTRRWWRSLWCAHGHWTSAQPRWHGDAEAQRCVGCEKRVAFSGRRDWGMAGIVALGVGAIAALCLINHAVGPYWWAPLAGCLGALPVVIIELLRR